MDRVSFPALMQNGTSANVRVDFRSRRQTTFGLVTVFICMLCKMAIKAY